MTNFINLLLNNGSVAEYMYTDKFDRPVYKIDFDNGSLKVCCVNLDGTHLHTMSKDGEPSVPVGNDYQPKKRD